jgi:hypothetical protein
MPYTNTLRLPRSLVRHTVSSKVHREWKAAPKAYTLTLATDLGRRFNKKPRYFLDLFFQGGVHLVTKTRKGECT